MGKLRPRGEGACQKQQRGKWLSWDIGQGLSDLRPVPFPAEQAGLTENSILDWWVLCDCAGNLKNCRGLEMGCEGGKAWLPVPWMYGPAG